DNVVNTIAEYRRIDMLALANAIESGGLAEISVPAGIALDPTGIAVAGGQLRVDVTLANQGPAATGPFVSRFYLSTDGIWDAGDAPLLTIDDDIGPGQTSPRRGLAVPLPEGLAPGEYFLLLKLDADQQVAEGNEGNNLAVVPITIEAAAPEVWVGMAETGAPIVSGVTLIEFGRVDQGQESATHYFTIVNDGSDVLHLGAAVACGVRRRRLSRQSGEPGVGRVFHYASGRCSGGRLRRHGIVQHQRRQ
ncbi:MAG TPA: CARDB domain-containing protein, partial [Lacipirellulaceae bacterium]|nr:CARDB domain-containing protein [Lacipirellulaceae bacterium]